MAPGRTRAAITRQERGSPNGYLDDLHEANVEVARALAPLPLQDTLETTASRERIIAAGLAVIRAVGLHVELAVLLGKLEAAAGD